MDIHIIRKYRLNGNACFLLFELNIDLQHSPIITSHAHFRCRQHVLIVFEKFNAIFCFPLVAHWDRRLVK